MMVSACPSEETLLEFVDGDLPPETLERLRAHVAACQRCRDEEAVVRRLIDDTRAPPSGELDVSAHARAVMARIDSQSLPAARRARPLFAWAAAGSVAASALLVAYLGFSHAPRYGIVQARGGPSTARISRDVGVEFYAGIHPPRRLAAGARVSKRTPFVAGFRNLGQAPAFLLLFLVDARSQVHFVAPPYPTANEDPEATRLPATVEERLLENTAVFPDLAPGPLRMVAVVTRAPLHVSDIERLPPAELTGGRLDSRFQHGSVRELTVHVEDEDGRQP